MVNFNTEFLLPKKYFDGEMIPEGIIWHSMSAINAHTIFDASQPGDDPFDVGVNIAILKAYRISAHGIIARDGDFYQLVPWGRKARHAGVSMLNGRRDCNNWTVGIEFLSLFKTTKEHGPAYTDAQIKTGLEVRDWLFKEFGPMVQAGHDEVRDEAIDAGMKTKENTTPARKPDPGKEFPWDLFRSSTKPQGLDRSQQEILAGRSEKWAKRLAQADGS